MSRSFGAGAARSLLGKMLQVPPPGFGVLCLLLADPLQVLTLVGDIGGDIFQSLQRFSIGFGSGFWLSRSGMVRDVLMLWYFRCGFGVSVMLEGSAQDI
ncbi:hypothetical protein GDO81_019783 [Engystomops pustulosus]|uniref:Uncharacterized protein n=1 Tax=Engystomops pustulosus TaxID=76066 RepID=A0AAV6Z1L5_ENGPU|nr:hypothetical protein GDO81_019783 [Engystomops pustulosus]